MHQFLHRCAAAAVLAITTVMGSSAALAVTLYDGSLGTLPSAQGWTPLVAGADAAQSVVGGSYRLDTTGAGVAIYGSGRISPVPLNTATGFDLSFTLRLESEAHTTANRAGYSVLFVGANATQSLELGFWANNVWAYDYDAGQSDRFVHGLDAAFDTGVTHNYTLAVRNQQYTLSADGELLLSGVVHDYTPGGPPYTQPNFLYFGDDSSRAVSVSGLAGVSVTAVPEPAPAALLLSGLALLAWRSRRQRG